MLIHRVLTAVVGIPVALLLIYLGGWYLACAVMLVAIGGLRELYGLLAARERQAFANAARFGVPPGAWCTAVPWIGYPLAVLLVVSVGRTGHLPSLLSLVVEAALLLAIFVISARWLLSPLGAQESRLHVQQSSATLSSLIYIPLLFSYLLRLRDIAMPTIAPRGTEASLPAGALLVTLLMGVIWGMDTAAYAVGKTLGRHKLCPTISPGKTVEGAIAALVAAVCVSAALGYWFRLPLAHGAILGLAVGIVGQAGDLFESALKRRSGVKDSGSLLPGHGGILDRFDSLLFAAPVAYFYLSFVVL